MKKTKALVQAAFIAAIYVLLSFISRIFNLDSGVIQVRLSEALCVLPCFLPSSITGLTLGCFIFNFLSGGTLPDILFGSLATFIGAFFTRKLKNRRYLSLLPPILSNTIIVPLVLKFSYGIPGNVFYFALTVGLGEIISVGLFGSLFRAGLEKSDIKF